MNKKQFEKDLNIRLTAKQLAKIKQKAKKQKMTVSEFLRNFIDTSPQSIF